MPIRIDKKLPAVEILRTENIFDGRPTGCSSGYSPMKILILNHASKDGNRNATLTAFGPIPLPLDIDFLYMEAYRSKTTRAEHMEAFYKTFPEVKDDF